MSSHIACFNTEKPIFPPVPQPGVKGHGPVSDYEKHMLLHDFVIPTVQDNDGTDPQPQPTKRIPIPTAHFPSASDKMGDPELCLSPERPERPGKKVSISPERPQVRKYQSQDPVPEYSERQLTRELQGIDIDVRPTIKQNLGKRDKSSKRSTTKENEERNKTNRIMAKDGNSELSRPVYNSTMALGQHLQMVRQNKFDAEDAVLKVLQTSESTQYALSEKVSEVVNVPAKEKKYSGLISIDVPVEETVNHVIEEKMSKVKARPEKKTKEPEVPGPDIMEFFTEDLQEERAHWSTGVVPKVTLPLEQAPDSMAFDLYRHMQWWQQH
ncbi:protein phosphatase 1 regulatory subunit 35-like [Glandiceps talaboti]